MLSRAVKLHAKETEDFKKLEEEQKKIAAHEEERETLTSEDDLKQSTYSSTKLQTEDDESNPVARHDGKQFHEPR